MFFPTPYVIKSQTKIKNMGRTLHLTVEKKDSKFTDKELKAMYDISLKFNSGKFANIWSVENFFLSAYDYYPNWEHPLHKGIQQKKVWSAINKRIGIYEKTGIHRLDAIKKVWKDGFILLHGEPPKHHVHTFCKVQGNELNALLVLQATIEISRAVPKATFTLNDEGEFLLCKLEIKNGLAVPIVSDLIDDIKHYAFKMLFSKGFKGNVLKKLKVKPSDFQHEFKTDSYLENSYGDMTEYIDRKLTNLKLVETALLNSGKIKERHEMYFYNLEKRLKYGKGFDPYTFTRASQVDMKQFLDYKMSVKTLMDGFGGEHYEISKKDAEAESYKSIARIQKILGLDENSEIKMEILKEV